MVRRTGRWLPAGLMAFGSLGIVATLAVAFGRSAQHSEAPLDPASTPTRAGAATPSALTRDTTALAPRAPHRAANNAVAVDKSLSAAEPSRRLEPTNDRDLALGVQERRQLTDESELPPAARVLSPHEQAELTQGEGPDVPPKANELPDPTTLVDDDLPERRPRVLSAEEQRRLRDDAAP